MVPSRMDISRNRQRVQRVRRMSASSCATHSTLASSTDTVAPFLPSAASCACCATRSPIITLSSRITMTRINHRHRYRSPNIHQLHRQATPTTTPHHVITAVPCLTATATATSLLLLLMLLTVHIVVRPYILCTHYVRTLINAFVPIVINTKCR